MEDDTARLPSSSPTSTTESVEEKVPYVLAVDVGTTIIRSHIYDKNATIQGRSSKKIELLFPKPGYFEMDPDTLFEQFVNCVKNSIAAAQLVVDQITCMGIATQRNTFTTWDRETGRPFHNFITWQDLRSKDYVKEWNRSYTLKALNMGARFLHSLTRNPRHLAASILKFLSAQVTMRLFWLINNNDQLRKRLYENQVMFGCLDTWLLWKLTDGKIHATDYSCASSTGIFDPYQLEWSSVVCNILRIPLSIFPEIRDTSGLFETCHLPIFGSPIPITALVADQQSALFGDCCFDVGDVKCTLGSGTFIDLNTGSRPHTSIAGLYPLVGWKIGSEVVFVAEGFSCDTGRVVEWAKTLDLFDEVSELANIAESVPDNGGVYFVGAFSGLQAPICDDTAASTMIGMTPKTTKAHIMRAILESIAFRFKLLYETMLMETKLPISAVRVNGGVSSNRFIVQLMTDLTNNTIEQSQCVDMTNLGAAFLAGLGAGVWTTKDELIRLRNVGQIFKPQHNWETYKSVFHTWERVVNRSKRWYINDSWH